MVGMISWEASSGDGCTAVSNLWELVLLLPDSCKYVESCVGQDTARGLIVPHHEPITAIGIITILL